MPRILLRNYSSYYDPRTKVQFSPVLDRQTGCYVAIAQVSNALAKEYKVREGFELITETQFIELSTEPDEPEPDESDTGSPLTDPVKNAPGKSAPGGESGPPPPPPGG